jgi:hypothetical protein
MFSHPFRYGMGKRDAATICLTRKTGGRILAKYQELEAEREGFYAEKRQPKRSMQDTSLRYSNPARPNRSDAERHRLGLL